jgi:hypothetical protein
LGDALRKPKIPYEKALVEAPLPAGVKRIEPPRPQRKPPHSIGEKKRVRAQVRGTTAANLLVVEARRIFDLDDGEYQSVISKAVRAAADTKSTVVKTPMALDAINAVLRERNPRSPERFPVTATQVGRAFPSAISVGFNYATGDDRPAAGVRVTFSILAEDAGGSFHIPEGFRGVMHAFEAVTVTSAADGVARAPTLVADERLGLFLVAAYDEVDPHPLLFVMRNTASVSPAPAVRKAIKQPPQPEAPAALEKMVRRARNRHGLNDAEVARMLGLADELAANKGKAATTGHIATALGTVLRERGPMSSDR